MDKLEVRVATEADLPEILRLHSQPGMQRATDHDGAALTVEEAAAVLRKMARYPDYAVYVAVPAGAPGGAQPSVRGETVVGTFALLVMDNLAHRGAPSAVVEDVCVDLRRRRQGVGRALMEHARRLARDRGCYKLTLSSNLARTEAHAFYRALGFEQHGLSFYVKP